MRSVRSSGPWAISSICALILLSGADPLPPSLSWTGEAMAQCDCPCYANPICDEVLNIGDLIRVMDAAFRSGPYTFDPPCAVAREDVDCSGLVGLFDVARMTNVVLRGFDPATQFCDPNPSPCSEILDPDLCNPAVPTPNNSVVVESKTVSAGAIGVQVGVYIDNSLDLRAIVLPLEIRTVTGGAYMAGSYDLSVNGRIAASGLMDSPSSIYYETPEAGNPCSGPVSQSYGGGTGADSGMASPPSDAVAWYGFNISSPCLAAGSDGAPGTGIPSFLLTFDVGTAAGTFEIDTCCVTPANQLLFAECGSDFCLLPSFTKGVITVGTPPACNRTETDPYLLACPKGDIFFDVTLKGSDGFPLAGYDAWLDFSDCSATEFLPQPGEYPSWPLVYSSLSSDENGLIRFAIAAGGDCTDCEVTVNTACGFSTTVPVRSVDIDGDMCVTILDRAEGLGDCRDVNADGLVDEHDILRLTDHCCGHCFPNDPCDRLTLKLVTLGCGLQPEDVVQLTWSIYNSQLNVPCDIDSVVIYDSPAAIPPVWERVGAVSVGQTLDPGDSRIDFLEYTLPASQEFGYQARLYTSCCDSFLVVQNIGVVACQCPPTTLCFEFYVQHVDPFEDTVVTWSSPDLQLLYGWTYSIRDTINDSVSPGPLTIVEICTSDITPVGRGGILTIDFCPAGGFCQERLQFEVWHRYFKGDLCGGPNRTPDCRVDVFDVVCLVDYIFRGGPLPNPPENADINCDEVNNVLDIVTLVDFVFRNNAQPPDCNLGPGQF